MKNFFLCILHIRNSIPWNIKGILLLLFFNYNLKVITDIVIYVFDYILPCSYNGGNRKKSCIAEGKNEMEKEKKTMDYRVEKDSIGTKDVPEGVYYGVQSLRAAENFHITGLSMHPEIINSLAYIKKAAAITNCEVGLLDKKIANAIVKACDEIPGGTVP